MLRGKQGLAVCGHRDDHFDFERGAESLNQGIFIELVRFRAETDQITLLMHLGMPNISPELFN